MLSDPVEVGAKRLHEAVQVRAELRLIIKEDKVQSGERFRYCLVVSVAMHDWGKSLVQRSGERNLFPTDLGGDGVWADHENDRVRFGDQGLDALPPLFEGEDIAAINEHAETTGLQGRRKIVSKGRVSTRIG